MISLALACDTHSLVLCAFMSLFNPSMLKIMYCICLSSSLSLLLFIIVYVFNLVRVHHILVTLWFLFVLLPLPLHNYFHHLIFSIYLFMQMWNQGYITSGVTLFFRCPPQPRPCSSCQTASWFWWCQGELRAHTPMRTLWVSLPSSHAPPTSCSSAGTKYSVLVQS